jgi:hypothetical protein
MGKDTKEVDDTLAHDLDPLMTMSSQMCELSGQTTSVSVVHIASQKYHGELRPQ